MARFPPPQQVRQSWTPQHQFEYEQGGRSYEGPHPNNPLQAGSSPSPQSQSQFQSVGFDTSYNIQPPSNQPFPQDVMNSSIFTNLQSLNANTDGGDNPPSLSSLADAARVVVVPQSAQPVPAEGEVTIVEGGKTMLNLKVATKKEPP